MDRYSWLKDTIFIWLKDGFPFQNNPKDLDPSCKMDLDLWDSLGLSISYFKNTNTHGSNKVALSYGYTMDFYFIFFFFGVQKP